MARVRKAGTCTAEGKYTPGTSFSPGVTAPTASVGSSADGITEFTSYVFDGDKKGQLFACKYKQALYELSSAGKLINTDFSAPCLDVVGGPGGALYMVDQANDNVLKVRYPVGGVGAWDVFPCRGTSGVSFILSGNGFSTTGTTTVTFGTSAATSVKVVNARRITGNAPNIKGLVDITVNNAGKIWKIPQGYKGL